MNVADKIKIKLEDIMFWILIALIVGVAIWKLAGSPTDTATLIAVVLFFAGSEILIWKDLFKIGNNTKVSFMKVRNEMNNKFMVMENEMSERFSEVNSKLDKLNSALVRKR